MMKNILSVGITLGVLTLGISLGHAQGALDQLKAANNGKQDTGTTFDGSSQNQGKGTIDTTVQSSTQTPTSVAPSSGTAGGYSVAPSSGTTTAPAK